MKSRLLLNVVVREGATVLELLAGEDQTLLVRGDALLVLNPARRGYQSATRSLLHAPRVPQTETVTHLALTLSMVSEDSTSRVMAVGGS